MSDSQQIADLKKQLSEAQARNYQANLVLDYAVTLVDRLVDKYRDERERAEFKTLERMLNAYFDKSL